MVKLLANSKTSPKLSKTFLTRVPFPTPEGPTTTNGLYLVGVGLKGWKYSLAYKNTSFGLSNYIDDKKSFIISLNSGCYDI